MTIPVLMVLGYGAGAAIAYISEKPLSGTPTVTRTRYFLATLMFSALLTLAGLSLYVTYPDWSLMYLANPSFLPWALVYPLLGFAYFSAPPVGFFVARRLLQYERPWVLRMALIGVGSLGFLFVLSGWERFGAVAYYDAFHHGLSRVPIAQSTLLTTALLHAAALLGALGFTLRTLMKHAALIEQLPFAVGDGDSVTVRTVSETHGPSAQ